MKLVRFRNIPVVVNLTWVALGADTSERRAIKTALEQNKGVKAGVVVKYGGVTLFGMGPVGAKPFNAPSASAWLSQVNQKVIDQGGAGLPNTSGTSGTNDWIVVENMNDGTYWLAIIRDGVPLPGTDVTYERDVTLDIIREALDTAPFMVYSTDQSILDEVPAGTIVEHKGFADLVEGTKPNKSKMKTVAGAPILALAAVGLLVLLGLGWFGYSQYAEKQRMKLAAAQLDAARVQEEAQRAKDKQAYTQDVQKAVVAALEEGERNINGALSSADPNNAIGTWMNLIADTSLNQNGWDLAGFTCNYDVSARNEAGSSMVSCDVSLTRSVFGVNRMLLEDHPNAVIEGDKATFAMSAPIEASREGNYRDLEKTQSFNLNFVSDLQMLHLASINYQLGNSAEIEIPVNMPPLPASTFKPGTTPEAQPVAGPVKMGVQSGELSFSGTSLWQIEGLREFLQRQNISIKNMEIKMDGAEPGNWTLTASYYIRSAPEPTLPVITDADKQVIAVQLPERFRATPEELAEARGDGGVTAVSSSPVTSEGEAQAEPSPNETLDLGSAPLPPSDGPQSEPATNLPPQG